MRRAARTLGAVVAVVCCLASAAVAPAQADPVEPPGQGSGERARHPHTPRSRTAEAGALLRRSTAPRVVSRPSAVAPVPPTRQPVTIETLTPSRLVPGEPVQITGTVLNNTQQTWGDAQVGMLADGTPLTAPAQLAAASSADPFEDYTGEQILSTGTFDDIGDIAPGQSRSFSVTVPYRALDLDGTDGAYWVGVELRATDAQGLRGPVERTLTFLPLINDPAAHPVVDLALLMPLTAPVPWNGQEFLDDSLSSSMMAGGRLRALAELGASSGTAPLTWVIDPAVLDAARRMSGGFEQVGREVPPDSEEATAARRWLDLVRQDASGRVAMAVPYGNPDVAPLAREQIRPGLRHAERAADRVLDTLGIARVPLLWPAGGRAGRDVLRESQEQIGASLALLSRSTFGDPPDGPVVGVGLQEPGDGDQGGGGQGAGPRATTRVLPALVIDRNASRQGLRAQPGQTTLQWRQLLLANTALRSLRGGGDAAAVAMPSRRWWPDAGWKDADLFGGLQVPWVNRVTPNTLISRDHPLYEGGLPYPSSARRRELRGPMLDLIRRVRRTSRAVNHVLAEPADNESITDAAFGLSSSAQWRSDRQMGRQVASDFAIRNRQMLRSIDIEAPDFVTLSSDSGRFPISLTNNLGQPVTIELAVTARDPRMSVEPIGPVTLQRDQRVTVTVATSSQGVGITTLTARMMTREGRPFGPEANFQVRTTQIGAVVWVVMGIGAAILFVAAGRRIFQRVSSHRRRVRRAR